MCGEIEHDLRFMPDLSCMKLCATNRMRAYIINKRLYAAAYIIQH